MGGALPRECWLRHDLPVNTTVSERVSVSFNYRWEVR